MVRSAENKANSAPLKLKLWLSLAISRFGEKGGNMGNRETENNKDNREIKKYRESLVESISDNAIWREHSTDLKIGLCVESKNLRIG